jgi:alcohol dehydrogenase
MPASVTASTGIDALTHAIESYVAKTSHPMSDAMGLSAIAGISRNLARAFRHPDDLEAREAMSVAALQAGIAFSNASVALVHAMARPLGAHFHIPHGVSNAMLLETVMSYSISGAPERFAAVGRAMGAPVDEDSDERAAQAAVGLVGDLCRELNIPSLAEWGVDEANLKSLAPKMAQDAIASGSPANNPRVPSSEEIVEMYHEAYER